MFDHRALIGAIILVGVTLAQVANTADEARRIATNIAKLPELEMKDVGQNR